LFSALTLHYGATGTSGPKDAFFVPYRTRSWAVFGYGTAGTGGPDARSACHGGITRLSGIVRGSQRNRNPGLPFPGSWNAVHFCDRIIRAVGGKYFPVLRGKTAKRIRIWADL
jgi:hypothetical protein